jgi:hypothetical protein
MSVGRKGKKGKIGLPISQFTLSGDFVQMFPNAVTASLKTGVYYKNISLVLNAKRNTAGGYVWRHGNYEGVKKGFCQCCGNLDREEDMILVSVKCIQKFKAKLGISRNQALII